MRTPGSREERLRLARSLVIAHPEWGKDHINRSVKDMFGVGLRRIDVAHLKDETLLGRPKRSTGLASQSRYMKRIARDLPADEAEKWRSAMAKATAARPTVGFDKAYHELRSAGFIDLEVKVFLSAPNAPELFGSAPFRAMLHERRRLFRERRKAGWTTAQFISTLKTWLLKSKRSPFEFLRKEYRPPAKMTVKDYRKAARNAAVERTRGLARRKTPAKGLWMECPFCKHTYWGSTLSGQMPRCPSCGR